MFDNFRLNYKSNIYRMSTTRKKSITAVDNTKTRTKTTETTKGSVIPTRTSARLQKENLKNIPTKTSEITQVKRTSSTTSLSTPSSTIAPINLSLSTIIENPKPSKKCKRKRNT